MMAGKHLAETMAKVCGVDQREGNFPVGAIAQTSVVRINAIIVHHKINNLNVFFILIDNTSAQYLWKSLLDAMSEF